MKKLTFFLLFILITIDAFAEGREGKLGVSGNIDFASETMGDINDCLNNNTISPLSSNSLAPINSGMGSGGSLMYGFSPNIEGGISFDYIYASSVNTDSYGYSYNLVLPLYELAVKGGYIWPNVLPSLSLRSDVAVAYEILNGHDTSNVPSPFYSGTSYNASGLGLIYTVGVEYFYAPNFSIGMDVGYRSVRLNPVTLSGWNTGNLQTSQGSVASADFSGMITKCGLSIYFNLVNTPDTPTKPAMRVLPNNYHRYHPRNVTPHVPPLINQGVQPNNSNLE